MTLGDAADCTVCSNLEDADSPRRLLAEGILNSIVQDGTGDLSLEGQYNGAAADTSETSCRNTSKHSQGTRQSTLPPSRDQPSTRRISIGLSPIVEPGGQFSTTVSETVNFVNKGKESQRGRTVERCPRTLNPLERAESRIRKKDVAIEVDTVSMGKRFSRSSTFHEDPEDPCAILDDDLLEPCPHVPLCPTVEEVLNTPLSTASVGTSISRVSSTVSSISRTSSLSSNQPVAALTTVFNDCQPLYPAPTFPPETLQQVHPNISYLEYLAIRSSSPIWATPQYDAPLKEPEPPASMASQLPTEIIHGIYYRLGPADFNSARRTCRSWFIGSLDRSLLETMLRRGGFSGSTRHDVTANYVLDSKVKVNDEWLMSKRLARECALGPHWTGSGLPPKACLSETMHKSAFVHISTIDFNEVAVPCVTTNIAGTIFTVSCCGKFVMAANGCLVYIYELNRHYAMSGHNIDIHPGSLRPITSIICPRRVLACSMDTSSHRYAIAILLDGRMGLVCDITALNQPTRRPSSTQDSPKESSSHHHAKKPSAPGSNVETLRGTSFLDRIQLNSSGSTLTGSQPPIDSPFVFPGIATTGSSSSTMDDSAWQDVFRGDMPDSTRTAGPSSRHASLPRANKLRPDGRVQSILPPHRDPEPGSFIMPIETGPRSLYRNLCSEDDPPRSVAICPQRRCVAFGCSSGIELHWVDALTGQDLNRWFPLTAPSDFLFFLPPRRSVDSAKKLRLISSAAKPSDRPAIRERAYGGRPTSSPFWSRIGSNNFEEGDAYESGNFVSRIRRGTSFARSFGNRLDYSDHYRAVPLSDGYHILFIDPATDLLCMGSDAPVGGPTKLMRKIWFEGPKGQSSPTAYASGSDLSWGVRVIAAFGSGTEQSIWLFSVPSDIFATDQTRNLPSGPVGSEKELKHMDWLEWWPKDGMREFLNREEDPIPGLHPRSPWPVRIKGQEIDRCQGIVDLAIDSGAHMIVWAFSKEGIAKVWKLDVGECGNVKSLSVARDGTVRNHDDDGDIEMIDAPSSPDMPRSLQPLAESFDGSSSFTPASFATSGGRQVQVNHSHHAVQYDSEGDVLMDGLSHSEEPSDDHSQASFFKVTMAGYREEIRYASGSWTRGRDTGVDFIEELTGIARIDIEIR